MNKQKLTSHLQRIGIRLQAATTHQARWITSPSSPYPYPTNHFRNLKEVERHWKNQALQRLNEINIAKRAWKEASNDKVSDTLLWWAEGKCIKLPESLKRAIAAPSTHPLKSWRREVERLSDLFGDASLSWLHEAIIRHSTSTSDDL